MRPQEKLLARRVKEIRHPEHMRDLTLAVIGLWNMGYTDLKEVASLLWIVELKPLRQLFKMLKTSRNPVIRRCVDVGLPTGVCIRLPVPPGPADLEPNCVRCRVCRAIVNCVPCPHCSVGGHELSAYRPRNTSPFRDDVPNPVPPAHRTSAEPGSPEKIALMRERFERGEGVIHPKDKRIRIVPSELGAGHAPSGEPWGNRRVFPLRAGIILSEYDL